jgi:hypothetical protein
MKFIRALSTLFVAMPLLLAAPGAPAGEASSPVVVELFTSQGCSSCPPADVYLGDLAKREDILALGFHVDYWNYIGWTDPFPSKLATERQQDYARALNLDSVYTPQMVVNGTRQGVGADRELIDGLIRAAIAVPTRQPALTVARGASGGLAIQIGPKPGGAVIGDKPATVWLVTYDGEHTTVVAQGENGGRTLKDYQVVRGFRSIGTWTGASLDISVAPKDAVMGTGGVAVLLQIDGVGPIVAAAVLKSGG